MFYQMTTPSPYNARSSELSLHFGRRDREGLATLKKDDITFLKDDENSDTEYATLKINESTKKNNGTEANQNNIQ